MFSLMVLGVVALVGMLVLGLVGTVLSLVFGLLILPFKLLGWALKGVALLLALPFLAIFGVFFAVVFGIGMLAALSPLLLPAAMIFGLVWLLRRRPRPVTG